MRALELKIPPPVIAVAMAAGMWLIARLIPALNFETPGRNWIALVLLLGGVTCSGAGILAFVEARTTVNPHTPDAASALVTAGVYRYTRNPMYVGLLLALIAWAVALSNILALAFLPAFVAYITRFQIAPEERVLHAKFGSAYADYTRRVRRWL